MTSAVINKQWIFVSKGKSAKNTHSLSLKLCCSSKAFTCVLFPPPFRVRLYVRGFSRASNLCHARFLWICSTCKYGWRKILFCLLAVRIYTVGQAWGTASQSSPLGAIKCYMSHFGNNALESCDECMMVVRGTTTAHPQPEDTLRSWRGRAYQAPQRKEKGRDRADRCHLNAAWREMVACSPFTSVPASQPHTHWSTLRRCLW